MAHRHHRLRTLPLLLLARLCFLCSAHGALVEYTLTVSSLLLAPDCFLRQVLAVNGTVPGPVLYARAGDTLAVTVCNQSPDHGIAVHWHGLHQRGTPFYDGVAGVTQCLIDSLECMRYAIDIGHQAGTFFYHAHHAGLSADGLHGAIVIYDAIDDDASANNTPDGTSTRRALQAADDDAASDLTYFGWPIAAASSNMQHDLPSSSFSSSGSRGDTDALAPVADQVWLLADWFHTPSSALIAGLSTPGSGFQWVGEPNAFLLNGKGTYCHDRKVGSNPSLTKEGDCPTADAEQALYDPTAKTCGYPIVFGTCATAQLIHVICATSLSYLQLEVEGHAMEIVGVDGVPARATALVETLEINSGERIDVLLRRRSNTSTTNGDECLPNYRITVTALYRPNQPTLHGVLHYTDGSNSSSSSPRPTSPLPTASSFPMPPTASELVFPQPYSVPGPTTLQASNRGGNLDLMHTVDLVARNESVAADGDPPARPVSTPPGLLDRVPDVNLLLVGRQARVDGVMRWPINGVANQVSPTPSYFLSLLNYTRVDSPVRQTAPSEMIELTLGEWVEVVIQNTVALNGVCEQHAWHLHGMHFYLLGTGVGTFRPGVDNTTYNLSTPLLAKDSFTVFPRLDPSAYPTTFDRMPYRGQPGDGCGWSAIRFRTDHPGVWLLHCHIVWHAAMGMGVVLHVKDGERPLPSLPADTRICGDPQVLYRDPANLAVLYPALNLSTAPSSPGQSPPTASTTKVRWYDYIGPMMTIVAALAASAMMK